MNKKMIESVIAVVLLIVFLFLPVWTLSDEYAQLMALIGFSGSSVSGLGCFNMDQGAFACIVMFFVALYLIFAALGKSTKIVSCLLLLPCLLIVVKSGDGASLGFGSYIFILGCIAAIAASFVLKKEA